MPGGGIAADVSRAQPACGAGLVSQAYRPSRPRSTRSRLQVDPAAAQYNASAAMT
jgi:hypothetical protein